MTTLLDFAITAHGGLDRWNDFRRLTADLSIGGEIWSRKKSLGSLDAVKSELDIHREKITISSSAKPGHSVTFVPGRITLEVADSGHVESCYNPRSAFKGQTAEAPWDAFQAAYFSSYALWTYLTSPFLYTYPGFVTEELDPWSERGEVWRRLKITFPDYIDSHTREQMTYFGPDGLVRRHDYIIEVLGGARSANYAFDYREFQGIMVPTSRQVFSYDDDRRKVPDSVLVQIDIGTVAFS